MGLLYLGNFSAFMFHNIKQERIDLPLERRWGHPRDFIGWASLRWTRVFHVASIVPPEKESENTAQILPPGSGVRFWKLQLPTFGYFCFRWLLTTISSRAESERGAQAGLQEQQGVALGTPVSFCCHNEPHAVECVWLELKRKGKPHECLVRKKRWDGWSLKCLSFYTYTLEMSSHIIAFP